MYPCLCMNRGCCGGRDMTHTLSCLENIAILLPKKKNFKLSIVFSRLAIYCENESDLRVPRRYPRYCVGTFGAGSEHLGKTELKTHGTGIRVLGPWRLLEKREECLRWNKGTLDWRVPTQQNLLSPSRLIISP